MKKLFLLGFALISLSLCSCGNNNEQTDEHAHEDGSTHSHEDHGSHVHDKVAPDQQEFTVSDSAHAGSNGEHTHKDGETHSH